MISLASIAANPQSVTTSLVTRDGETLVVRPLDPSDVDALGQFLSDLSSQTRYFAVFPSYDKAAAQTLCDTIARYDKLRFVIQPQGSPRIVGLLEFSFAISEGDSLRYTAYGITLDAQTDCRFGPTLADDYQGKGVGTQVFPFVTDVARKFGKRRIILWGGVVTDNPRAIRYYEKHGFKPLGTFIAPSDGAELRDMLLDL
jgi:RimJ/RimL family protein N-acetyltransferase